MLEINYTVENAGWAIVTIQHDYKTIKMVASYLHDSLKELAESAIQLKTKTEKKVVFMDEPGEYWLVLRRLNDKDLEFEVRWYEDWASWNICSEANYQVLLNGKTTLVTYTNQVRKNLIHIHNEIGVEGYKEKWIEHDFPLNEYHVLK